MISIYKRSLKILATLLAYWFLPFIFMSARSKKRNPNYYRTSPNIYDILIAFFGLVGAIADNR
jgi:hypothetical protein